MKTEKRKSQCSSLKHDLRRETMSLETVRQAVRYYKNFSVSERKDFHSTQQQTARGRFLREHVETFEHNKVFMAEFQKGVAEHDELANVWDKREQAVVERDLHRATKTVKRP